MSNAKTLEPKAKGTSASTDAAKGEATQPKGVPTVPGTPLTPPGKSTDDKPIESKSQRFKRLAVQRTNAAVKKTRQLGNLANRSQYEYTDDQRDKIIAALVDAVQYVRTRFSGQIATDTSFTL